MGPSAKTIRGIERGGITQIPTPPIWQFRSPSRLQNRHLHKSMIIAFIKSLVFLVAFDWTFNMHVIAWRTLSWLTRGSFQRRSGWMCPIINATAELLSRIMYTRGITWEDTNMAKSHSPHIYSVVSDCYLISVSLVETALETFLWPYQTLLDGEKKRPWAFGHH